VEPDGTARGTHRPALTGAGVAAATALGPALAARELTAAFSSPLSRAARTAELADGDVALIGHGHLQRVLTARWLGLDPAAARLFRHPHPGTLSVLGTEHEQPVVCAWNVVP
jgi:broad specificity phosphatase PhoE